MNFKKILFITTLCLYSLLMFGQTKITQIQPCIDAQGNLEAGCFIVTAGDGGQHYTTCSGLCQGDDYVQSFVDVKSGFIVHQKTFVGICADKFANPEVAAEAGVDVFGNVFNAGDNIIVTPSGIVCLPPKDPYEVVETILSNGDTIKEHFYNGVLKFTDCQSLKLVPTESRIELGDVNTTTGVGTGSIANKKDGAPITADACSETAQICIEQVNKQGVRFTHECLTGITGGDWSTYTSDTYPANSDKSILNHVVASQIPSPCGAAASNVSIDWKNFAYANDYSWDGGDIANTNAMISKCMTTSIGGPSTQVPNPKCALSNNTDMVKDCTDGASSIIDARVMYFYGINNSCDPNWVWVQQYYSSVLSELNNVPVMPYNTTNLTNQVECSNQQTGGRQQFVYDVDQTTLNGASEWPDQTYNYSNISTVFNNGLQVDMDHWGFYNVIGQNNAIGDFTFFSFAATPLYTDTWDLPISLYNQTTCDLVRYEYNIDGGAWIPLTQTSGIQSRDVIPIDFTQFDLCEKIRINLRGSNSCGYELGYDKDVFYEMALTPIW